MELKWTPGVTAWVTTKETDNWTTEKTWNKRVMLFLTADDTEYDNVYLTTTDGTGYKLGFARGEEKQLLPQPARRYIAPEVEPSELADKAFEDFK